MSFPTDITVTGTSVAVTYSQISLVGGRAVRRNPGLPLSTPDLLTISHQEVKRDNGRADRHMVRFDQSKQDAEGNLDTAILYLVLEEPRQGFVQTDIIDLIDRLKNFLSAGNITKFRNSEP